MHQVVLLNGPSKCGKDTVVSHLIPYLRFRHLKFAAPLKRMAAALLDRDTRWIEENKDQPSRVLQLKHDQILAKYDTPRNLLIALSEDLLKQRYGDGFFGRVVAQEIRDTPEQLVILSDSGFVSEMLPVRDFVGRNNLRIIRIYRYGFDFKDDSRSYLGNGYCGTHEITNDGTIHDLTMRVLRVIMREFKPTLLREPEWIK